MRVQCAYSLNATPTLSQGIGDKLLDIDTGRYCNLSQLFYKKEQIIIIIIKKKGDLENPSFEPTVLPGLHLC